jgi:hypothetical protein
MARGLAVMGMSFVPLCLVNMVPAVGAVGHVCMLLACAFLLTVGTMMVFPFEMVTIAAMSGGRLIGTYYGVYNLLSGLGILAGNLLSGPALDLASDLHLPGLPSNGEAGRPTRPPLPRHGR